MKILRDELDTMHALVEAATPAPLSLHIQSDEFGSSVLLCEGLEPTDSAGAYTDVAAFIRKEDADLALASYTFVPRAIEALRFTEASTQEALLILDDAMAAANTTGICEADLLNVIDFAIQKLRPEPAPVHDAAALERLLAHETTEQAADDAAAGATYFYQHTDGMRVGIRFSKLDKAVEFMMLVGPNWKLDASSLPPYARPLTPSAPCVGGARGSHPNDAPTLTQDPAVPYGQPNARGQNEAAADNGFAS